MVPTTVQVVDDQLYKKFEVIAPLNDVVEAVIGSGPYTVTTESAQHLYQSGLMVKIGNLSAQAITVTGLNTFTVATLPTVGAAILPQTATHTLTWDYTEGDTPDVAKYSLNSFGGYNTGAVAIIQNLANSLK